MMSNRKTTKRALLTSVMALIMCVVMLVGTTFAWFTDTASTGVNKIQAGNLDVDIIDLQGNSLDGETLTWQKAEGAEREEVLWEPGCTYYLTPFMIQNKGNLALKYKVTVNGVSGDNKLLEALEFGFYYFSVGFGGERSLDELIDGGKLDNVAEYPGLCTAPIYIVAHMKEDAGNEYKELSIEGIGITVSATQYTYESDSFGTDYDENATYPVVDNAGLSDAITDAAAGETVVVASGEYDLPKSGTIASGVTLAGAGKDKTTLNVEKANVANDNITIKDMTINGEAPAGNDGALRIGGKNTVIDNVIFNGQGFNGDTKGISVTGENLTIRNSKISGAFRGITFWDNIGGDNLIENCTIDNVIYTFNVNAQTVKPGTTLTVKNSTLNGWTSYSSCMTHVTFDNCDLGASNGNAYLVAYADSTFTNCTFHDGYQVAASIEGGAKTLTFNSCKLADGTVITAENFAEKLGDVDDDMKAFTVIVDGVTVNWN